MNYESKSFPSYVASAKELFEDGLAKSDELIRKLVTHHFAPELYPIIDSFCYSIVSLAPLPMVLAGLIKELHILLLEHADCPKFDEADPFSLFRYFLLNHIFVNTFQYAMKQLSRRRRLIIAYFFIVDQLGDPQPGDNVKVYDIRVESPDYLHYFPYNCTHLRRKLFLNGAFKPSHTSPVCEFRDTKYTNSFDLCDRAITQLAKCAFGDKFQVRWTRGSAPSAQLILQPTSPFFSKPRTRTKRASSRQSTASTDGEYKDEGPTFIIHHRRVGSDSSSRSSISSASSSPTVSPSQPAVLATHSPSITRGMDASTDSTLRSSYVDNKQRNSARRSLNFGEDEDPPQDFTVLPVIVGSIDEYQPMLDGLQTDKAKLYILPLSGEAVHGLTTTEWISQVIRCFDQIVKEPAHRDNPNVVLFMASVSRLGSHLENLDSVLSNVRSAAEAHIPWKKLHICVDASQDFDIFPTADITWYSKRVAGSGAGLVVVRRDLYPSLSSIDIKSGYNDSLFLLIAGVFFGRVVQLHPYIGYGLQEVLSQPARWILSADRSDIDPTQWLSKIKDLEFKEAQEYVKLHPVLSVSLQLDIRERFMILRPKNRFRSTLMFFEKILSRAPAVVRGALSNWWDGKSKGYSNEVFPNTVQFNSIIDCLLDIADCACFSVFSARATSTDLLPQLIGIIDQILLEASKSSELQTYEDCFSSMEKFQSSLAGHICSALTYPTLLNMESSPYEQFCTLLDAIFSFMYRNECCRFYYGQQAVPGKLLSALKQLGDALSNKIDVFTFFSSSQTATNEPHLICGSDSSLLISYRLLQNNNNRFPSSSSVSIRSRRFILDLSRAIPHKTSRTELHSVGPDGFLVERFAASLPRANSMKWFPHLKTTPQELIDYVHVFQILDPPAGRPLYARFYCFVEIGAFVRDYSIEVSPSHPLYISLEHDAPVAGYENRLSNSCSAVVCNDPAMQGEQSIEILFENNVLVHEMNEMSVFLTKTALGNSNEVGLLIDEKKESIGQQTVLLRELVPFETMAQYPRLRCLIPRSQLQAHHFYKLSWKSNKQTL